MSQPTLTIQATKYDYLIILSMIIDKEGRGR